MREGSAKKNSYGKAAMGGLTSIWKDRGVTMETKVKLVKVLVFPIVLYGAETWTMRKHERRKIDAFELWCWRRVLRVSWMERKTNIWIIENIKQEWTLESRVSKAALSYFGHVVRAGGMEDDVMLGRMNGARMRGRPRQRWLDTLMGYSSGATISNMIRYARDRAGWREAATDVARFRLSSHTVKTHAYQALVRPHLEYASAVWDPHTHCNTQKLEMVQRRAARYA